jgi:uncharacterized membrane protein YdbT with pleckstrin-like domain
MKTDSHPNFPGQQEGEDVQLVFRQHPLVMRKPLILGLLAILFVVLPLDFIFTGMLYGILVKLALGISAAVLFIYWPYHFMGWYYSVYIVTDRRLIEIKQKGLFDRKVREWQLDLIQNLNYHINGFQAVIFHYGTITAETYSGNLEMPTVYRPVEVHTRLMEIVRKARPAGA